MTWEDLDFWKSSHWEKIQENLDKWDKQGVVYNPKREDLFYAMDCTPMDTVKVVFMGQDPYPQSKYATGLAFDIPKKETKFPPTLHMILNEYCKDLHHPFPDTGSLEKWTERGVLLWNATLTCEEGKSNSHYGLGWQHLTEEICKKLEGVVFILSGAVPREFAKYIDLNKNRLIETSHPSPRGNLMSRTPFSGSRIFSTTNGFLKQLKKETVNWRL